MIDETKLYRVTVKNEPELGELLAIHVMHKNGQVSFWDTNRHRLFGGTVEEMKDGFILRTDAERPREMRFTVLTLALYNELVRPQLFDPPEFKSDADMHEFYRRNF